MVVIVVLYNVQLGQGMLLFILLEGLTIAIMEYTFGVLTVIVLMLGSINRVTIEIFLTQVNVYFVNERKVVCFFSFRLVFHLLIINFNVLQILRMKNL